VLTKGKVLQGDISEVGGRSEKRKERERGVKGEGRHWKKSVVLSLM
jgi:hypothetical protein